MDIEKRCDIVIVNWNSGDQLADCIKSIDHGNSEAVEKTIVVDNASSDGSQRVFSDSTKLQIIETGENLGFGRACNLGSRLGSADYLLFLNPDTRLQAKTVRQVINFMEKEAPSDIGICGIRLFDETGLEQRHCAHFPKATTFVAGSCGIDRLFPNIVPPFHMKGFDHRCSRKVDHVIGAFYMIRRNIFDQLGGFDEDFFIYYEDLDLSYRVKQSGKNAYYLAGVYAFHKGGGTSEQIKVQRLFYSISSKLLYSKKHHNRMGYVAVWIAAIIFEPVVRLVQLTLQKRLKEIPDLWKSYLLIWGNLRVVPTNLQQRKQ